MKIIPSNLFHEEYDGLELQFHYISPQPNESLGWARNNGLTHINFSPYKNARASYKVVTIFKEYHIK